jgi:hypothetical protein
MGTNLRNVSGQSNRQSVLTRLGSILPRFLALSPLGGGLYGRVISFEIPSEELEI